MHSLSATHWKAIKRLLWYLKHIAHFGLRITDSNDHSHHTYSWADRAGDINEHSYTTGCFLYLAVNAFSWSSKKQCTVAYSSTEAKYRAVTTVLDEVTSMKHVADNFHYVRCQVQGKQAMITHIHAAD
ncbi:hypothetical protein ACH5RR_017723 [Cinchona calisaya]|uniref:Uncharacterized protein n=1 Tax=Cinchona calisaya TaxID=153742 RepID=A0ABD2ZKD2_9GENT